jgi:hypothetical protein
MSAFPKALHIMTLILVRVQQRYPGTDWRSERIDGKPPRSRSASNQNYSIGTQHCVISRSKDTDDATIVWVWDGLVIVITAKETNLRCRFLRCDALKIPEVALVAGQDVGERGEVFLRDLSSGMLYRHLVLLASSDGTACMIAHKSFIWCRCMARDRTAHQDPRQYDSQLCQHCRQ